MMLDGCHTYDSIHGINAMTPVTPFFWVCDSLQVEEPQEASAQQAPEDQYDSCFPSAFKGFIILISVFL